MNSQIDSGYTLVAYKPDSADYCRGCHMASYRSGFKFYSGLNKEDLIKIIAEIEDENARMSTNERGYGYIIQYGGISLHSDGLWVDREFYQYEDFEYSDYYLQVIEPKQKEVDAILVDRAAIQLEVEKLENERKEAAKREAEKERIRQAEWQKNQEIANLKRLKDKYPNI